MAAGAKALGASVTTTAAAVTVAGTSVITIINRGPCRRQLVMVLAVELAAVRYSYPCTRIHWRKTNALCICVQSDLIYTYINYSCESIVLHPNTYHLIFLYELDFKFPFPSRDSQKFKNSGRTKTDFEKNLRCEQMVLS